MKSNKRLARGDGFAFELETKKNLGQNFLADATIIERIVARAEIHAATSNRCCIEIGPGSGALTRRLLENGWKVHAIEKDERAVEGLKLSLGREFSGNLEVVCSDILKVDASRFWQDKSSTPLCIGNIPYYITSDILFWFLNQQKNFSAAILMIQKEVAERLASGPGGKDYGRLTVRTQLQCEVEQVLVAPASAFVPPPKVDSAVVELKPLASPLLAADEFDAFGKFTAALFSARRKMLRKTLLHIAHEMPGQSVDPEFATNFEKLASQEFGISFNQRPEELSPQILLKLFRRLRESRR
ncbi:ribosomal RNA small subunit methyltransferase A [bacterium]|nr:ribosomal RNA small subunit methyltransferase A [bacterium]